MNSFTVCSSSISWIWCPRSNLRAMTCSLTWPESDWASHLSPITASQTKQKESTSLRQRKNFPRESLSSHTTNIFPSPAPPMNFSAILNQRSNDFFSGKNDTPAVIIMTLRRSFFPELLHRLLYFVNTADPADFPFSWKQVLILLLAET